MKIRGDNMGEEFLLLVLSSIGLLQNEPLISQTISEQRRPCNKKCTLTDRTGKGPSQTCTLYMHLCLGNDIQGGSFYSLKERQDNDLRVPLGGQMYSIG